MVDHQVVTGPSVPCCPHHPGARRTVIQRKRFLLSYPGPSLEKFQRVWRGKRQQSSFLSPAALCLLTLLHTQGPKPGYMLALRVSLVGPDSETNSCAPTFPPFWLSLPLRGTCSITCLQYPAGLQPTCSPRMGLGQHLSDQSSGEILSPKMEGASKRLC